MERHVSDSKDRGAHIPTVGTADGLYGSTCLSNFFFLFSMHTINIYEAVAFGGKTRTAVQEPAMA